MGTRNLTAVFFNGDYKLAQYGQWDGYPSGQGLIALTFSRKYLKTEKGRRIFQKKLENVHFVSDKEHAQLWIDAGIGDKQYVSFDEADKFNKLHPYFSRDNGAKILQMVRDSKHKVLTQNSIDFAADSLFCEWAYVIDLDKLTFEVYKGFNENPVPSGERFSHYINKKNYYPIKLLKLYSLNKLPTKKQFLMDCEPKDDE